MTGDIVMYKIDMHVHTWETSFCGKVAAREAVKLYKDSGYYGIVITDHYYRGFITGSIRAVSLRKWNEKMELFMKGYNRAQEEGERIGLKVLLGMEIRFENSLNDYLVYGISEEFLKDNPSLYRLGIKNFKKYIEGTGILVYQAHPFRLGMKPAKPEYLDGIEVYNGNPRHNSKNHLALAYARENKLKMVSGSDFHQREDLARGGIFIKKQVSTSIELAEYLRDDTNPVELITTSDWSGDDYPCNQVE
jgi:predicted metal-dependent phosphoesterase TrpH